MLHLRYDIVMTETAELARAKKGTGTGVSVSLRQLVFIRWIAVIGQAVTMLLVHYGFALEFKTEAALTAVAISAALNIVVTLSRRGSARLGDRAAAIYLAYDTLQLGVLLFLTGGLENPFAILMLAPVTVSATILSRTTVIALSAVTVVAISVLAIVHLPLPARPDLSLEPRPIYVLGMWTALVSSTVFIAGYTWSVAEEARRMRDAFAATQLALAREQRISAVGGLAAAAAHQLGSPLGHHRRRRQGTGARPSRRQPLCRGRAASAEPERALPHHPRRAVAPARRRGGRPIRPPLVSALVEAAGEPHRTAAVVPSYAAAPGNDAAGKPVAEPLVVPSPEIMHGLGNLIQNAVQFARREVAVTTSWTEDTVTVDIVDDGPGFAPQVLARIGEPYLSGRSGETQHMGLGIFIAQSLLERTGARLSFANEPSGGAEVVVEWRREDLAPAEGRPDRCGRR